MVPPTAGLRAGLPFIYNTPDLLPEIHYMLHPPEWG